MTWDTQRFVIPPRFPGGLLGWLSSGGDPASAGLLLPRVVAWRDDLAAALAEGAPPGVSPEMRAVLLELVGAREPRSIGRLPYRLGAFPAPRGDPEASLDRILLWRAGIVDFLSDAWDTAGEPLFDMDECEESARIFLPEEMTDESCRLCLGPLGEEAAGHFQACPVQEVWSRG